MDIVLVFVSFCGGLLASAMGALGAFAFVGVTGLIGIALSVAGSTFDWLGVITFGPFFGPHISFGGACAAAAYASRRGYIESGKDIGKALITLRRPDVLIVGGIFGIIAYVISTGLNVIMTGMIDTVAFTVFLSAIIAKVSFGTTGLAEIFGKTPDKVKQAGGRFSVLHDNVWLPWQNTATELTLMGIVIGGLSGYVTYLMLQIPETAAGAPFVGFCIGVAAFLLLLSGINVPIFHHIALGASYGVLMSGSLMWGVAGGIIGAFAGDYLARLFLVYGDCWVDPPGMSISFTSFLFFVIAPKLNLFNEQLIIVLPAIIIALSIILSVYQQSYIKRNKDKLIGSQTELV